MAQKYPVYSTKVGQPGVAGQLADLQKYGRNLTPMQWVGQTLNATPTELAIDNFSWSLPASTSGTVPLFNRLTTAEDSVIAVNMYGACFDVTSDNLATGNNAAFFAQFSVANVSGVLSFLPVAAPTVNKQVLAAQGATLALVLSLGVDTIIVTATGVAATTINWHINADMCIATFRGSPALGQFGI